MMKTFWLYTIMVLSTLPVVVMAQAEKKGPFKERVLRFFNEEKTDQKAEITSSNIKIPEELDYNENDWADIMVSSDYNRYSTGNLYSGKFSGRNIDIFTDASIEVKGTYGKSIYTDDKYKQYDEDEPSSRIVTGGFYPEQIIKLQMNGTIDNRISLYIDHDSEREENIYKMKYKAIDDDEMIREVNVGEIDIKFDKSRYAVYDNSEVKGLGADFKIRKGDFEFKAFGSVILGNRETEFFTGNSRESSTSLRDYQYTRKVYYQLEPFIRYDGATSAPGASTIYSTVTLTSAPSNPKSYTLNSVNIKSSGFAIYMDDRNAYNNSKTITLSLDGGSYKKLSNGTDYSINYTSGVIKFLCTVPDGARIFVVYNISGGTRDPCALDPSDSNHPGGEFAGKNFVFIKYGESLNEDTETKNFSFDSGESDSNNDGKVNLDIYEIRSYYYLGETNILSSDFYLTFYDDTLRMTTSQKDQLGKYSLDLDSGLVKFRLREPFKSQLSTSEASVVYNEVQITEAYLSSRYKISADYYAEARNFKLKNTNIVKDSVTVKVNGSKIADSLYTVNRELGIIVFTDESNPVISSTTKIEVRYDYLPQGTSGSGFVGGMRADYKVNRSLSVGASMLMSKGAESDEIPDIGEESDQTLMFEGDATLTLSPGKLADIYNLFTTERKRTVPLEIRAYGEYAKSYRNVNTFGKALLENMETTVQIVSVSLSEKDWQLSSMPQNLTQSNRGILNYYYYRSLSSTDTLRGESFSPYSLDYSVKPGPFNIATGHVDSSITSKTDQRSLVFDYDFTSGDCVSVVTRKLSDDAVDFSGLKYVELWVRHDSSTSSNSVNLYMDIGQISEDSDGDGNFDTEDANTNGYIDSDADEGTSEDRGYTFNGNNTTVVGSGPGLSSDTKGDGKLNTEDQDGDGSLDTTENVYTVDLGSVTVSSGTWKKIRVYIDWSSLSSSEVSLLQEVRSVRFYATRSNGTTGRLFVDGIKLVGSKWRNPELDGTTTDSSDVIKASLLNTIDDSDYRSESFLYAKRGVYESLYGEVDSDELDEERETTLQLDYDIPGVNSSVSIKRTFSTPIDIRFYRTLNLWMNARAFPGGTTMGIIVGSSDYDYREYRIDPTILNTWEQFSLKLTSKSDGDVDVYSTAGNSDLKRITYLKVVFYGGGTSGTVWLNDIYVSEPMTLSGRAYWYENEVKFKNPLYRTSGGVPVLSDMNLKYVVKGNSAQFSSLAKENNDTTQRNQEFTGTVKILPHWDASLKFTNEHLKTDSENEDVSEELRGETWRNILSFVSNYISKGPAGPKINFTYTLNDYENMRNDSIGSSGFDEFYKRMTHSPTIKYSQTIENFLFGSLRADAVLQLVFKDYSAKRSSDDLSKSDLASYIDLNEIDKRQRSDVKVDLEYSNSLFYLKPIFTRSLVEIVGLENSDSLEEDGVYSNVSSGFHFPFYDKNPGKYVSRNNIIDIELGHKTSSIFNPAVKCEVNYREYDFEDYDFDSYSSNTDFSRTKSALSSLNMKMYLPIKFGRKGMFRNIKNLNLNYSRKAVFTELSIPYEGESTGMFDEQYGLSRVMSGISPAVYNLYRYYPGYFYRGRGNFGRGRDSVYRSFNEGIDLDSYGLPEDYDNSLKLSDDFSIDSNILTGIGEVNLGLGVSQVIERSNIEGIPGQIVTYSAESTLRIDLMNIFNFWFFRTNRPGISHHRSFLNLGLSYNDSQIITSNVNEKKITPDLSIEFKWGRSNLALGGSLDYRHRSDKEYIDYDTDSEDIDYIYIENMADEADLKEADYSYKFRIAYDTEMKWLFDFISGHYKLTGIPVFSLECKTEINRYDYINSVSPEPYDLYYLKSGLVMNIHKYVKGEVAGAVMLERFYSRDDEALTSEVFSFEISGKLSIIF